MIYLWKRHELNERIYILAYIIFIIKNILDSTQLFSRPEIVDTLLVATFLLLIGSKLLSQTYNSNRLLILGILGIVYVYSTISVKYYSLLSSFLCICSLQDVDIRKVLKASASTKTIIISIHVIAYFVQNIIDPQSIKYYYRNGVERHNFLLGHPNMFMGYLAWTCLEIIYLNYNKCNNSALMLIWFVNLGFYKFTDSNTSIIVLTIVIFMIFAVKKEWIEFNKLIRFFSKSGYAICAVFFTFIAVVYTRLNGALLNVWGVLNDLLTGRLLYGAFAYDVYGFTVFGRKIVFPGLVNWRGHWIDSLYFDNAYLWFLITFGVIHIVILSTAFFLIEKKTTYIEKILVIAFALYGIMEGYIVNVFICFPLLFIGKYMMNKTNDIEGLKV